MSKSLSALFAFGLIFVLGCGQTLTYTPMTQTNRNAIKTVDLYNLVIQDEIKPSVEISNASLYLGGGLLGVAIDSSVNKGRSLTAQDIIEPLYNASENLDYRVLSAAKITPTLAKEFIINTSAESAEAVLLTDQALNEKVANLRAGEALLYLSSFYSFLDNSKTLATETVAFVYMNSAAELAVDKSATSEEGAKSSKTSKKDKTEQAKLVYFNRLNFQSESIGEGATHSIDIWSKDDGKLFKEMLNASLENTASMLVYDLQPILTEECAGNVVTSYNTFMGSAKLKGKLLEQRTSRAIVRADNGALVSLAGTLPISINKKSKKSDNNACES